jgi:hypothetical protein
MRKQRLPRPRGAAIDLVHTWIRRQVLTLKREITALKKKGILLAYPHFKKGTNMMYLLEPTREGKRRYHYIGGNDKDQKIALEKIERYHKTDHLGVMLAAIEYALHQDRKRLDVLFNLFMQTHRTAEKTIIEGQKFKWRHATIENGVTPRSCSRPRPVTLEPPDYDEKRACRICGCTEYEPCPGGCSWVEEDLCSNPECVKKGNKAPGSGPRVRYPEGRKR